MNIQDKFSLNVISYIAIGLAIIHMLWPSIGIDGTTIALLIIAFLPTILPYIKTLELPGGIKIEARELKSALEKILTRKEDETELTTDEAEPKLSKTTEDLPQRKEVTLTDPRLTLIGLRIEIEKRLLQAASINNISIRDRSLQAIIQQLVDSGILPVNMASGLREIVLLGNRAAHGEELDEDAAALAMDAAPKILKTIDAYFNF